MAQRTAEVLPRGVFDPNARPSWTTLVGSMQDKMGQNNIHEGIQHAAARAMGMSSADDDSFLGLRQSLMGMGKAWDEGVLALTLQDEAQTSVMLVRVCPPLCLQLLFQNTWALDRSSVQDRRQYTCTRRTELYCGTCGPYAWCKLGPKSIQRGRRSRSHVNQSGPRRAEPAACSLAPERIVASGRLPHGPCCN